MPDTCEHPQRNGSYCLECVYAEARATCVGRNEGWRWGLAEYDPKTGKDKL